MVKVYVEETNMDQNKIMTDVMSKVVEDTALGAWNGVKRYFKDLSRQSEIDLGIAFERYIENTKEKNSKIKTLIYRHAPKDLYSFYVCIGVRYETTIINTESVNNVLELGNKIIISGTGGIGKSTLLKHFFLNCLGETSYIPVMIELRSLNGVEGKNINIFDTIYENLITNGFILEKQYFEYSMIQGGYLILFDGYDEVKRENISYVSKQIRELADKYSENKYIISSRPTDDFIGWNDFIETKSMELNKKQALSLIDKIDFDEKVKKSFYKELDDNLYKKYESFASNPLLLTMMLLTYDTRASIPAKLNDFYEQAFATLFNMHDATKDTFVRDIRSRLGYEDFKLIFSYICFKTYFASEFEFREYRLREYINDAREKFKDIKFNIDDYLEDLIVSVCMIVKDGLIYKFSHRSFQEYFAAWYTCKLTDDIQYKLLTGWIKEQGAVLSDSYFSMLFDLQSEKVNRIILCPGIRKLKQLYENLGFSIEFLDELFRCLHISSKRENGQIERSFSLSIKNKYLCEILKMTCEFNNYQYGSVDSSKEREVIDKIISSGKYKIRTEIKIQDVLQVVSEEELLQGISWLQSHIEFCFQILDEYGTNTIGNKRKVASILEQL